MTKNNKSSHPWWWTRNSKIYYFTFLFSFAILYLYSNEWLWFPPNLLKFFLRMIACGFVITGCMGVTVLFSFIFESKEVREKLAKHEKETMNISGSLFYLKVYVIYLVSYFYIILSEKIINDYFL